MEVGFMDRIQDYVFYAISKGDRFQEGYSYGIKRGIAKRHSAYFASFMDMGPYPLDVNCLNWNDAFEQMATSGNIIIANAAVEIEDVEDRFFVIYLPTVPTSYQIKCLELISRQLKNNNIDVGVYGNNREEFLKARIDDAFDCHSYLKEYIGYSKYFINHMSSLPQTGRQKVKIN
jgi:hypothetical protein